MKIALLLVVAAISASALSQSPLGDVVLSSDKAFKLMPPRAFANGTAHGLQWSSDGKYVMVVQDNVVTASGSPWKATDSSNQEIVVYSAKRGQAKSLFTTKSRSTAIKRTSWIYNSTTILAEVEDSVKPTADAPSTLVRHIYSIDAASGSYSEIARAEGNDEEVGFETAPEFEGALLTLHKILPAAAPGTPMEVKMDYVILKSNGKPAGTPSDMKNAYFNYWAEDGTTAVFQRWEQRQMKVFLLNLRTGSFKETDAPLDNIVPAAALGGSNPQPAGPNLLKRYRLKDPKLPVHLQLGAAIAKAPPTSRNLKPLFLASDIETEPRALVVGDFNEADLAPDGSAVAYITQGLAVVRPISTADRSAYEQALKAEEKTRLLSQAKQVAVAILIHSADNDDNLISNKVDVAHELEPYVRNKSLLEGLVYTFSGGSASDIAAPAETELGYVPGAGGRAVIYADGHVVWKDDK